LLNKSSFSLKEIERVVQQLVAKLEVTVDLHGDSGTINGGNFQFEVETSNNLGLSREDLAQIECAMEFLRQGKKTSASSDDDVLLFKFLLFGVSSNKHLGGGNIGVNTLGAASSGLFRGEALGDRAFNTAQVVATSHSEVTFVTPVSVPAVSEEPIILAVGCAPANQFDAMATSNRT